MQLASPVSIAVGVTLLGLIVIVWALARGTHVQPPQSLMVMPLGDAPQPRARFAKGSVEFASVDASEVDVERSRTLRPSHARRTV